MDDLNPVWNTDYYVPVSHPLEYLEFRVKDWDQMGAEEIGVAHLPVSDLMTFGGVDGKPQRTGVHRVVYLDGNVRNGAFEFYVEYIPCDMMHSTLREQKGPDAAMVVPGVYFKQRQHNQVRLYINADDKTEDYGTPAIQYGKDQSKKWKPQRLWRDIYDSWCQAKELIYIVGWSVDYRQSLLRGEECKTGLNQRPNGNGTYSPYIGELLKQKADEGVTVNLLIWDDNTSTRLNDGVIGTRDEYLRNYFRKTKVTLRLVPMGAGNSHVFKKIRHQSIYFTHHQKCVIVDTPKKELMAFVGTFLIQYAFWFIRHII
jgi:phospholipase D1/2